VLSLTARHPARAERLDFKRFIFGRAVGRAFITPKRHGDLGTEASDLSRLLSYKTAAAKNSVVHQINKTHSMGCNALPNHLVGERE
jgi:hypothetical protein